MFDVIRVQEWRQFGRVEVHFHSRLTVLTGANASGKTTLLNILSRHFGWNVPFVRTPRTWRKRWSESWFSRVRRAFSPEEPTDEGSRTVGEVVYRGGQSAELLDPGKEDATFQLKLRNQQPVKGLHIPSHRPVPSYQPVDTIPARPRTKQEAFNNYMGEVRNRYMGGGGGKSTTFHIKETLVSLAMGYGNEKIPRRQDLVETLEGFEAVLRATLPEPLGFRDIGFEVPDVFLNTATGPVPFDAISGGIASIMDISWQIYMYAPVDEPFVVLIDEPENHLHPALQRTLLGSLTIAFPQVQFIVATHSPFVVSAVADSNVYVLEYQDGRVYSVLLEAPDRSASADGILREVLGVPSTFPVWVDREVEDVVARYGTSRLTAKDLRAMREDLAARGLAGHLLDALDEAARIRGE